MRCCSRREQIKTLVAVLTGLGLVGAVALGVAAQDDIFASLVQPLVVNVQQAVPVDVTLAVDLGDGEIVEVTTPITVAVAMQVKIDGSGVVAVTAGEAETPVVEVAQEEAQAVGGALVDSEERAYEIEAPDDIAVANVASSVNVLDMLEIIGEITNDGSDTLKYVQAIATLYDAEGNMLSVDTGFASVKEMAPGQTSPFQVMSMTAGDDVASYRLQVQP